MLTRLLPFAVLGSLMLAACGGSSGPQNTPQPVVLGAALQTFLGQAYESGWFAEGDEIDVKIVETFYEPAAARAAELGLGLYATAPGTPPYSDGLPGFLITATGDFFDYDGEGRPPADTPRRPAVSAGYVDTLGRFTWVMRFVDESSEGADQTGGG